MLDKVLKMIKMITDIEKLDDTKILVHINNKLADEIIFKNVSLLVKKKKKSNGKYYPEIFLEETLRYKALVILKCLRFFFNF